MSLETFRKKNQNFRIYTYIFFLFRKYVSIVLNKQFKLIRIYLIHKKKMGRIEFFLNLWILFLLQLKLI